MARGGWVRTGARAGKKPSDLEKRTITVACEKFIEEVLKPRFLPEIRPTEFNYCIDIFGKWHGANYRFLQRFRNDRPDRYTEREFTSPFVRLEYVSADRFDISYFRHTGQWWPVDRGVTLDEALEALETTGIYHPIV